MPGHPSYSVKFTITVDDLVAYLRLQQRTLNRIGTGLGFVALALGAVFAILASDLVSALGFGLIGLVFLFSGSTEVVDRWRVRRGARSIVGSTPSYVFDDIGIKSNTFEGSGRIPWTDITDMRHSDRVLVVKRGRLPVVWIPNRAFASTAEAAEVEDFIRGHVAARS